MDFLIDPMGPIAFSEGACSYWFLNFLLIPGGRLLILLRIRGRARGRREGAIKSIKKSVARGTFVRNRADTPEATFGFLWRTLGPARGDARG